MIVRRGVACARLDRQKLVLDDGEQPRARTQDLEIIGDLGSELLERFGDLLAAEGGQPLQTQVENAARLRIGEAAGAGLAQRVARIGDQRNERRHVMRRPLPAHQGFARRGRIGRCADQSNDFVDIGDGDGETDLQMRRVARLVEFVLGAPGDDLLAEVDEGGKEILERQRLRPAAVERDHIRGKARLQRGEAPELIEHHVGDGVALQLDDDTHAIAVGFVAQVRNAFDLLVAHKLGDLFDQNRLVHLIGDLADDQGLAFLADFLDLDLGAHQDRAAPDQIGGANAGAPENRAAGRKIRTRDDRHQLVGGNIRPLDHGDDRVDDFAEIMRRDVGRHADRNAAGAVDEKVGEFRRQNYGLAFAPVVVRLEIDRLGIEIVEQRYGSGREPHLGIALGRGRIAVDRAEIALAVDQRQAHRERLRHAHQRVVDREIAVRVIFAHRIAGDARRFVVGAVRRVIVLIHRIEDTPVHRLQAVAHVG